MARLTVTLDEEDIKAAIESWVSESYDAYDFKIELSYNPLESEITATAYQVN